MVQMLRILTLTLKVHKPRQICTLN